MNAATPAKAPGLERAIHGDATACPPRPAERRHGVEYLESRGFDYRLALFWGAYAACVGSIIGWFWS